jgi:hypothetical protein
VTEAKHRCTFLTTHFNASLQVDRLRWNGNFFQIKEGCRENAAFFQRSLTAARVSMSDPRAAQSLVNY